MRRLVSEFIDEILERGDVDLAASLAHPLPLSLVSHIMGIPKSDQPVVTDWFFRLVERGEGEASVPGAAHQAAQEYSEYVREAVSSRRRSPRDDLFTRLAAWEGTGEMSAEEVVRMTIGMLIAGIHTTESLIATALLLLQQMAEERTVLATSLPSPGSRGASCWRSSSGVYPATMSSARLNDGSRRTTVRSIACLSVSLRTDYCRHTPSRRANDRGSQILPRSHRQCCT